MNPVSRSRSRIPPGFGALGHCARVVVFSPYFPPAFRGGGPIRTLAALVAHLPANAEAVVVTRDTDLGQRLPLDVARDEWVDFGDARVRYVSSGSAISWWKAIRATRSFRPDFVYVNSFFDARFSILPQLLARVGVFGRTVVVLAPRGEFGSEALALKPVKKRAYLRLFKILGLGRGVLWHASSQRELADISRVIGHSVQVVVRENDTDLPAVADLTPARLEGPLRAVHVARLVPIKGVDILLTGLGDVTAPLSLDIFGPAEDRAYADRCRQIAESLPAHISVNFMGLIDHALVRTTISDYDVMLFPTRGENFGHVIAEALSVSCPVMCADTTPWTARLREGGGVIVEPDTPEGWAQAVNDYAVQRLEQLERCRGQASAAYAEWRRTASEREHLFTILSPYRPHPA